MLEIAETAGKALLNNISSSQGSLDPIFVSDSFWVETLGSEISKII